MKAKKHLYDHIVFDSTNEQTFAAELDTNNDVAVYVKLPDGFFISTHVGHYNPDLIFGLTQPFTRFSRNYFRNKNRTFCKFSIISILFSCLAWCNPYNHSALQKSFV